MRDTSYQGWQPSFGVLGVVLLAIGAGLGVAAGGMWTMIAVAAGGITLLTPVALSSISRLRAKHGYLVIEVPVVLLLLVTLQIRARTADELADNPLDPAGRFRLACTGAALLLGAIGLLWSDRQSLNGRPPAISAPVRLYCFYVLVAFVGAVASVAPLLTLYRALQLLAVLLVMVSAYRHLGNEALYRIKSMLYWWVVVMVFLVWAGVFLFPGLAVTQVNSPIPFQIAGVFPGAPSNSVGTWGVVLAVWSLGRLSSPLGEPSQKRWISWLIAALGIVTLVAAQYRTGYAALALGLALLVALRGRKTLAIIMVAAVLLVSALGSETIGGAQPYVLRGQSTERAADLSGRLDWWKLAIPVWKESPYIGGGLRTASRFLVLGSAGFGDVGTIHSTWIEALVGTGAIGLALLAASYLLATWRSISRSLRWGGPVVPTLLLVVIGVRSVTGSTFEHGGYTLLLFLTLALGLKRPDAGREPSQSRPELSVTGRNTVL